METSMSVHMAVVTHPVTGDMHMAMTASQFTEEDAARWRSKGFIVEVIPYEEYERRSEVASRKARGDGMDEPPRR
jgi:hypothetical protein